MIGALTVRPLLTIDVDATPAVQGNHRISPSGHVYEASSARLRAWRDQIAWSGRMRMRTTKPCTGAIRLELAFRLKRPARGETAAIRRPDIDKLERAVLDALTGIVYVDDSQVTEITATKVYSSTPGVLIHAWELGEEPVS